MREPITRIELWHVAIPLPATFYPSWIPRFPQTHNSFTLLRLTTRSGLTGWSAGVAMEDERSGLGSLLGPYLLEADALDIETVAQRLREASYLGWRNAWIEAAFWDIRAKAAGKPLYQLLLEEQGLPVTPVDRVPVYLSMGTCKQGPELRAYIDEAKHRGVPALKIRVHDLDEAVDLEAVRQAREFAGPDLKLMVDANQGWRVALLGGAPLWDLERATRFGEACDAQGFTWIEEPLPMDEYDLQAELRRRVRTPIAGGELNGSWAEFRVMLEKGCYDIYQPDACFAGGISHVLKLMRACREDPALHFSPHTWSNGVGFRINLQLYATWPRRRFLEYPYQPPGWVPGARDGILDEPIALQPDGTVAVPQEPGIGIHIDRWKLRRYGRKFYDLTKPKLIVSTLRKKGLRTALELARVKKQLQAER